MGHLRPPFDLTLLSTIQVSRGRGTLHVTGASDVATMADNRFMVSEQHQLVA